MRSTLVVLAVCLGGCATAARPPVSQPVLQDEGSLYVYLAPLPHESRRLTFEVQALTAAAEGGQVTPLQVALQKISGPEQGRGERLLATGRLAPGRYAGLRITVANARLAGDGQPVSLTVGEEPARIDAPFDVRSGQAVVLTLQFDPARSIRGGVEFTPRLTGAVPARTPPTLVGA